MCIRFGCVDFEVFLFQGLSSVIPKLPRGHCLSDNVYLVVRFFRTDGMFGCSVDWGAKREE